MVESVNQAAVDDMDDDALRSYAQWYVDIEKDFLYAVQSFGLPMAESSGQEAVSASVASMAARGLHVDNDGKSLWVNWISPSCIACRLGIGTETFLISTQCPRDCFFCFNPNQADYEHSKIHVNDVSGELKQRYDLGVPYEHIAVTGGEPLLHQEQTLDFLRTARMLYPKARTRLYTSGFGLDGPCLDDLIQVGLDEVRFSVKLDDAPDEIEATLSKIESCTGRIGDVMVEMPVMPDRVDEMRELLVRLDSVGVSGVNLLELCFPFHNAEAFARRGYQLKPVPYQVPYNYWYAGGVPVAYSEEACIDLLKFALDEGLNMGLHYCSLENKLTGQVYQQNCPFANKYSRFVMSVRDHFLKSVKIFGADASAAETVLLASGETRWSRDVRYDFIEVHPEIVPTLALAIPDAPVAISYSIVEIRDGLPVLRELAIKRSTLRGFRIDDL